MMGAVYERFNEIASTRPSGWPPTTLRRCFSRRRRYSLRLAPSSVFNRTGAVPLPVTQAQAQGQLLSLELNYSSLSAISSTLIVMATVFLSTLYPAKKAADMAVPDVTRNGVSGARRGQMGVRFPIYGCGAEVLGMYTYLTRVLNPTAKVRRRLCGRLRPFHLPGHAG